MRRLAFAALVCAGCSFDGAGLHAGGGDDARTTADAAAIDGPIAFDAAAPDAMPPPPPPCPNDSDLVACYRFESGTAAGEPHDDRGNNDGTSSNVTFIASLAGHGSAISFSPTASAVVPPSTALDVSEVTVEFWLYVRTLPQAPGRAGLVDYNGAYGLFLAPDGGVRCAIGSATDIGLKVPVGAWTHVACTFDGNRIALFMNGAPGPTLDTKGPIPIGTVDGMAIGQNSPTGDHLDGAIDDVRIWQVARDAKALCTDAAPACN